MTEAKIIEREYVIPLRKEWVKVPRYKRTSKSVKAVKEFIAKHMKVQERDVKKVKIDPYLNNELWFRGSKKPPIKIKVRAKKEGEIVRVEMSEVPQIVQFSKSKVERLHKKEEKKEKEIKTEEKKEEKKEGEVKEYDKEKEEKKKAEETLHEKIAEQESKTIKHVVGKKKQPQIFRKALKK